MVRSGYVWAWPSCGSIRVARTAKHAAKHLTMIRCPLTSALPVPGAHPLVSIAIVLPPDQSALLFSMQRSDLGRYECSNSHRGSQVLQACAIAPGLFNGARAPAFFFLPRRE